MDKSEWPSRTSYIVNANAAVNKYILCSEHLLYFNWMCFPLTCCYSFAVSNSWGFLICFCFFFYCLISCQFNCLLRAFSNDINTSCALEYEIITFASFLFCFPFIFFFFIIWVFVRRELIKIWICATHLLLSKKGKKNNNKMFHDV